MNAAIEKLVTLAGVSRARACELVERSRASHFRAKNSPQPASVVQPLDSLVGGGSSIYGPRRPKEEH